MFHAIRLMLLCLWPFLTQAQTTLSGTQVRGGLPAPVATIESQWCPSPALTLVSPTRIVVGTNWSTSRPCYLHFNLTPPAQVDPINASRMTAPATIDINNGALPNDLYIWARPPAWGTTPRPVAILVGTKRPSDITCTNCIVENQGTLQGVPVFPAFSMPIGVAAIEQTGTFHPWLDIILDAKQIYIGANIAIAWRRDQAGSWMELSPQAAIQAQTAARVQQAQVNLMAAQADVDARNMRSALPPIAELAAQKAKLDAFQKDLMALREMLPSENLLRALEERKLEISQLRDEQQNLSQQLHSSVTSVSEQVYMSTSQIEENFRQQLNNRLAQIEEPKNPKEKCEVYSQALGSKYLWVCVSPGRWTRVKLSNVK